MSVKEQLLILLEENRTQANNWLSGEQLAGQMQVSRAAVWKAVQALREEGVEILSAAHQGYRLSQAGDHLSKAGICAAFEKELNALQINVLPTVDSTNTCVRALAVQGCPEGTVLVAGSQTAGRGRLGRSFYSPGDTGLYMSVLVRPTLEASRAVLLTTAAAVAVCEALEAVTGRQAQIKWVNDVFLDGKKVCGILTEAAFGTESGTLEYAIAGIGINVYPPQGGFPEALQDIAGSVYPAAQPGGVRNRLAAAVLARFWHYYRSLEKREFLPEYRRRSLVLGREIVIQQHGTERRATALAIDEDCHLLVQHPDGSEELLSTGEISVRLKP